MNPDEKEILEDLIVAAMNDARGKAERAAQERMAEHHQGPAAAARPEAVLRTSMAQSVAGPEIERLIQLLARLPGSGPRSARRAALHLIKKRETLLDAVERRHARRQRAHRRVLVLRQRRHAGSLHHLPRRQRAIRRSSSWSRTCRISGRWSAPARSTRAITCSAACSRRSTACGPSISTWTASSPAPPSPASPKSILALNATVDGQTTAHYITELLAHLPVKVTKLAHGVPVGGELDYLDEGTLSAAIRQRTTLLTSDDLAA